MEALIGVDLLVVLLSVGRALNTSDAHELSVKIGPRIIIPMQHDKETLAKFLKEEGTPKVKPIDKLTIKKKDMEGKEGEIVIFS